MKKLILLNGFAGSGKTTIANRYIADHLLTLKPEGDDLIAMLGQWKEHYAEASVCRLVLSEALVRAHLAAGHDVILPFLLVDADQAAVYERLAQQHDAVFFEIYLALERESAVARLMKRGTWGEPGLPPLTPNDLPDIYAQYDAMVAATQGRPNTIVLYPEEGDIEGTYQKLLQIVEES